MPKVNSDNCIQATFTPYDHLPSLKTVAIGLGIGAGNLLVAKLCFEQMPWLSDAFKDVYLLPETNSKPLLVGLALVIGVVAPFFDEAQYRADLEKPSGQEILMKCTFYGAIQGLLPCSSVETRVARVFLSTIAAFFYTTARVTADDVWASAIAHSLCNLYALKSYF